MIPLQVLNRLQLGRNIAAPIPAALSDHRAWVHVRPLIDENKGFLEYNGKSEPTLVSYNITENPIIGFKVRHVEIHERYQDYPQDYDIIGFSVNQEYQVESQEELEELLLQWLTDLSLFRAPSNVGYIFGR